MSKYRLLAAFAHPDDESHAMGGTLARYVREGVSVTLVCATRGEAGSIADPSLATRENLGQVRERELRAACGILGITDLRFLGYQDGHLEDADLDEVEEKLVRVIREVRPHVMVTFGADGGTGHPDHIAIHRLMGAAFAAAGDPDIYPQHEDEGLAAWDPQRLFYAVMTKDFARAMAQSLGSQTMATRGIPAHRLGTPETLIDASLDTSEFVDLKIEAIRAHRTQALPNMPIMVLPEETFRQFSQEEHFTLGLGQKPRTAERLDDLFEGLG